MKRRTFNKLITAGAVGALSAGGFSCSQSNTKKTAKKPALMHVGCQRGDVTIKELEFKARHGIKNIDGKAPNLIQGVGWDLDDAKLRKHRAARYGISIDAYHLPLSSAGIDRVSVPHIMLGKSPERDHEIEMIQQMISVAGQTGVRALLYNTTILPVVRTERTLGRGNATYSTWDESKGLDQSKELTRAGVVDADTIFERISYFLERVIPVAEEYKVQLGNHIADPPLPAGFRGITRWNSPNIFEGIKRYSNLSDSPYHGFNLCLGSAMEGMKDPDKEIHEVIRYVGGKNQIFNVHMRNIKGGWGMFQEVYPDNGDVNFFNVIRSLRDVEYKHMIMPDHVPKHNDDPDDSQGFAFCYGYLAALINAANTEVA
ncbi:MAG: mannonate dehydratase [Opitutaceae bacterium]|nr:mannonate dehydratase [Opitutaceae bacterium]|tara:strand:- start:1064 stop:2179 length:1116 start_codon:yes stop_codon:yes gene_type:complete